MRKILPILALFLFFSCQNEQVAPDANQNEKVTKSANYLKISGETMGTTYHITYSDSLNRNFKPQIDSLLVDVNQAVSTYIEDSEISMFNKSKDGLLCYECVSRGIIHNEINYSCYRDETTYLNKRDYPLSFGSVFYASKEIYEKTNGYFDPTVMPLVNYWGFGYKEKKTVNKIDSLMVDSLSKLVGFDKMVYDSGNSKYRKNNPHAQLDFSAIAKGYGVDLVAYYLSISGIENYLVEIGGEMIAQGKNPQGEFWTTAINTPKINARLTDYEAIVSLNNKAIATSGNYRNFYEVNGDWYGHTINPKTGFPEKSNLLSVSVLAETCMMADGYATAFMVMGLEKSKALVEELDGIDAFFIFANEKGELEQTYTQGFDDIAK